MKKKIAIFQSDLGIGGIQKSLINLLNNLDSNKYEIDLYIFKEGEFSSLVPSYVNVIKLTSVFSKIKKMINFNILLKLCNYKYHYKEYDIAIDYNGYDMDTSIGALKVKSKKKIIWVHNDLKVKYENEFKYRLIYFFCHKKFDYFDEAVCVSIGAEKGFKEKVNSNIKTILIPNYINVKEIIDKSMIDNNFEVLENKYNFGCLGRLCYQKGYDILLDYLKKLLNYRRDFHLYFIGDGPKRKDLEKQVQRNGLVNYVTFLGTKSNPYSYLKKLDCLLFSSRYEGQGMVLLEAKCLGLDIIMPKYLEKYCNGISGYENILDAMKNIKKKNKEYDYLLEYNQSITNNIEELLGDENAKS